MLGLAALGCTPGGVGDPCTPEDEYQQNFNGFQVTETNVESRSFQCETRLCMVNHFQGRVSCRMGQAAPPLDPMTNKPLVGNKDYHPTCSVPGTDPGTDQFSADNNNINVAVKAQLQKRQTDKAVYCSCRCDGPDKNARYCECPTGFQCEPLVANLKIVSGGGQLAGSYCIRSGSKYDANGDGSATGETCSDPGGAKVCGCDGDKPPAECGKIA
ncbi:MAG TPA: hypothetical protein VNG33_16970, partial [Polyangiaceae bacterium]|nr:hypothetical protein [Polyangiaceae bacterium]